MLRSIVPDDDHRVRRKCGCFRSQFNCHQPLLRVQRDAHRRVPPVKRKRDGGQARWKCQLLVQRHLPQHHPHDGKPALPRAVRDGLLWQLLAAMHGHLLYDERRGADQRVGALSATLHGALRPACTGDNHRPDEQDRHQPDALPEDLHGRLHCCRLARLPPPLRATDGPEQVANVC